MAEWSDSLTSVSLLETLRVTPNDERAWERFVWRYRPMICRWCREWGLQGADAEDVAQDVCCALVDRIGGFRGEAKFSTWLCGITVNACRDLKRRRRSLAGLTERLAVLAGLSHGPDGRDLHDAMWVKSAVARLPTVYREAVALVAGQQLSHAEAAAILGIAEATVSWRLHEARRRLAGGTGTESAKKV